MSAIEWLQENYWIMIIAYVAVFCAIIVFFLTKNRGKILVRVKRPGLPELEVWKKPEVHGQKVTINMRNEDNKKAGWRFTYDSESLVPKKGFLRSYFAVDVKPDATRACKWAGSLPDADQPELTKDEVKHYAKTESFKWHFQGKVQGESKTLLYIILIAVIALGIINFLVMTGRLKL